MKKTLILLGLVLLASVPHALAQGFVPLAPIPGLTEGVTADTAGLAQFFNDLYKYLIGFSAMLAVIMIIWGGIEYSTQDSISKQSDGRERITQAIFGLILVLSPVLVFTIINPNILNLSLSLPPIRSNPAQSTQTSTSTPAGGGTQTSAAPTQGSDTSGSRIDLNAQDASNDNIGGCNTGNC